MIELLQISRGGTGGVTGAKILAEAALYEGMDSQAIPKYGAERRGAAVEAYVRFDDKPIRIHSPVYIADHAMILEKSLIDKLDLDKVKDDGIIIVNTKELPEKLKNCGKKIAYVNATKISQDLGLVAGGMTLVSGTILGAYAKATGLVSLENVEKAIINFLGERRGRKNVEAAKKAYEETEVIEVE